MVALVLLFSGLDVIHRSCFELSLGGQLFLEIHLPGGPLVRREAIPISDIVFLVGLIKWSQGDRLPTLLPRNQEHIRGSGKSVRRSWPWLQAGEQGWFVGHDYRKRLPRIDSGTEHQRTVQHC